MSQIYPKRYEEHLAGGLEGKANSFVKSKSKKYFKREFGLDKNKGCIPGKTAHREYQK